MKYECPNCNFKTDAKHKFDHHTCKPKKLNPDNLKVGDLFRGKYWRYSQNQIFKEYDKELYSLGAHKGRVISLCNRWFDPNEIYEPKQPDTKGYYLCGHCFSYKQKGILDKIKKERKQ